MKRGNRSNPGSVRRPRRRLPAVGTARQLVANLPAALYTCDAQGHVTFFNPAAAELWGREPEIGKDLWCGSWRIFRPDGSELPLDECPMAVTLREGRPVRGKEIVIERPDGTRRHVRPHPEPLFDRAGRLIGASNLLVDITAQRASDAARAHLAAIVQTSDDAVVSKDLNGVVTSWNHGATRLFGYQAEEMIGQPITLLIPADHIDEEPQVLSRIRRGESIRHYQTVRRRKDGTLVDISLTVSPIVDDRGVIVGASKIARDITEQKRTEEALRNSDQRKDEFLATLAHELRNPLAPLMNSLEYLRMTAAASPALPARVLGVMERQVNHLTRLVDDLLDVSRISRGTIQLQREPVLIADAVQGAVEISKPLIEAGRHRMEISLPSQPLRVFGDRTRLTQIIANLLNNAAKYTPPEGLIRVVLERAQQQVVLRVSDNGIGIPAEKLGLVFHMFTQVHSGRDGAMGGLGIGLSLVDRLVALHGGSVEVRSAGANCGSEFIIRLPLREEAADAQPREAPAVAPPVPARRVLVVDDNRDAAESVAMLLRTLGHEVQLAHTGSEALDRANAVHPDLVLLDLGMPGMDGYDVATQLRALPWAQAMRIVALTGWGHENDRRRTAAAGFDHHLVKPVGAAALENLLADPAAAVDRALH